MGGTCSTSMEKTRTNRKCLGDLDGNIILRMYVREIRHGDVNFAEVV